MDDGVRHSVNEGAGNGDHRIMEQRDTRERLGYSTNRNH
jgi:hypothetical protein